MFPVITNVLIPGRHHVLTNFQYEYLQQVLQRPGTVQALDGHPILLNPAPNLIWAVTSANHSGTRRNPLPANRRETAIEHFGLTPNSFTYLIDDLGPTPRFADHVIKDIEVQSRGQFRLSPQNTVVAVSTPAVIQQYQQLGYRILPLELVDLTTGSYCALRPWDLVLAIVKAGSDWRDDETYRTQVHPASQYVLQKYRLGDTIHEVHADPLLGDEGDITGTRNYVTYRQAFEDGAARKYEIVRPAIRPGRIVDIGCATGAIIRLMSQDDRLAESDLYGVEVARPPAYLPSAASLVM